MVALAAPVVGCGDTSSGSICQPVEVTMIDLDTLTASGTTPQELLDQVAGEHSGAMEWVGDGSSGGPESTTELTLAVDSTNATATETRFEQEVDGVAMPCRDPLVQVEVGVDLASQDGRLASHVSALVAPMSVATDGTELRIELPRRDLDPDPEIGNADRLGMFVGFGSDQTIEGLISENLAVGVPWGPKPGDPDAPDAVARWIWVR